MGPKALFRAMRNLDSIYTLDFEDFRIHMYRIPDIILCSIVDSLDGRHGNITQNAWFADSSKYFSLRFLYIQVYR